MKNPTSRRIILLMACRFRCGAQCSRGTSGVSHLYRSPHLSPNRCTPSELTSSVEKYSGGSTGSSAAFQGQGQKLGDGSKAGSKFPDLLGVFNVSSEVKVVLGLAAVYLLLMFYY
jgi:hypothetical protein